MSDGQWDNVNAAWMKVQSAPPPSWQGYLGFYSSWLGGYFREPWAMVLPLDDHGFHRGDGVFEAIRIHGRAYFDLQMHLQRLENSARRIGMQLPKSLQQIQGIVVHLAKLCGTSSGLLRLYVTRGPGGFSPSPAEVTGHQIYAAITTLKSPSVTLYEHGCKAMISSIPAKDGHWSQIKSCNYLQNVMMKQECLARGFDFAVSVDDAGRLCEGATENLLVISAGGELIVPKFDYTLRGTTVSLVMQIAEQQLVQDGTLTGVRLGDVRPSDLLQAREAAFVGTTLGVLPITQVNESPIGTGKVGQVAKILHAQLLNEMLTNANLRTIF
jgi:branched-subunit amino acid aminotransferase/4-amino-4-deoxychorismate lyase